MSEKRTSGQPVTLTDLFGMVIGEALLDVSCLKLFTILEIHCNFHVLLLIGS